MKILNQISLNIKNFKDGLIEKNHAELDKWIECGFQKDWTPQECANYNKAKAKLINFVLNKIKFNIFYKNILNKKSILF